MESPPGRALLEKKKTISFMFLNKKKKEKTQESEEVATSIALQ